MSCIVNPITYSQPNCFLWPSSGIYLPLLWEDSGGEFPCHAHSHLRNPLILGYNGKLVTNIISFLLNWHCTCTLQPLLCTSPLSSHSREPGYKLYYVVYSSLMPMELICWLQGPDPILYPLMSSSGKLLPIPFLSQAQQLLEPTQILSKLLFIDLIPPAVTAPSSPSHLATSNQTQHAHQTLAVISTAAAMPEVMETLVKRYQSLFLWDKFGRNCHSIDYTCVSSNFLFVQGLAIYSDKYFWYYNIESMISLLKLLS